MFVGCYVVRCYAHIHGISSNSDSRNNRQAFGNNTFLYKTIERERVREREKAHNANVNDVQQNTGTVLFSGKSKCT